MKRYSLNMRRIVGNIVMLVLLMIALSTLLSFTKGTRHINTKSIIVYNNDTLWNIANKICKDADKELNVQNIVIEIKHINNLQDSTIFAGQALDVPVYI